MLVDFHVHYTPKKIVEAELQGSSYKLRYTNNIPTYSFHPGLYNLEGFLKDMDTAGIDLAFLSSGAGLEGNLDTCKMINDDLNENEEKFNKRFRGLAHVPPLGGKNALMELERAVTELGFRGAAISSSINGVELDSKALWPFFEKAEELGIFVFVHPSLELQQSSFYNTYDMARSIGREFALVVSTVRLINGGVFDTFPNLRVVMSHLGGGISAILGRIISYQNKEFWGTLGDPVHGKNPAKPFEEYFGQILFDTGGVVGDVEAVKVASVQLRQQLVFGSDYPQEIRTGKNLKKYIDDIRRELSVEEAKCVLENNTNKLVRDL